MKVFDLKKKKVTKKKEFMSMLVIAPLEAMLKIDCILV